MGQTPEIIDMLKKLDEMFCKERELIKEYRQLKQDIELLEIMIMHQSNKRGN